ncbi:MAG: hypothetical protein GWN53_08395, partial [Gammaproteobacteria bacterium]|nr:hypothetical protein [Gammaproteobacteria bacterium]
AAIRERIAGWFVHGSMPAAATRSIVHELLNVLMLYVPFGYLIAYALHGERRVHAPGLLLSVIMLCSVLAL